MGKPNIEVIVENQRATGNSPSFSLDSDQFSVQVVGDGGGVYHTKRNRVATGNMRVVGFLKPF